jgi:hypothetical protein
MKNSARNFTYLLKATGQVEMVSATYQYIFFRESTGDFLFSFDGTTWFDAYSGLPLGPLIEGDKLYLKVAEGRPDTTVKLYVSNFPIPSAPKVFLQQPAPTYPVGNMGFGSQADIDANNSWYVSGISLPALGLNYTNLDILTVAGGTGTAATLKVRHAFPNGAIQDITIRTAGRYSVKPATPNTPTGGTGTGAQVGLTFTLFTNAVLAWVAGNLTITTAGNFAVPNTNLGNARKSITFDVDAASAVALRILDATGKTFCDVQPGQTKIWETGGPLSIIAAAAGTCTFRIGELYFA